jgi:hypothetical protein
MYTEILTPNTHLLSAESRGFCSNVNPIRIMLQSLSNGGGAVLYTELLNLVSCHQYRSFNYNKKINPTCPNQTGLQKKQPWYLIQEKMPLPSFQPIIQNFGVCPPKTQDKKENAVVTQTQSSNPSELPNCPKHNYKNRESPSIHLALALVPHLETSRNSDALLDILESLDLFQRTSAHADFFE